MSGTCTPPESYEEWLACLEALHERPWEAAVLCQLMRNGVFHGMETSLLPSFQRRLLDCVNKMLDQAVLRFSRQCQELLETADFSMLDFPFRRLAIQIRQSLFFRELLFLPEEFRLSTENSLKERMTFFWNDTIRTLKLEASESGAQELEDIMEAIQRIQLFPQSALTFPNECRDDFHETIKRFELS